VELFKTLPENVGGQNVLNHAKVYRI